MCLVLICDEYSVFICRHDAKTCTCGVCGLTTHMVKKKPGEMLTSDGTKHDYTLIGLRTAFFVSAREEPPKIGEHGSLNLYIF